jgi:hypothetical protein
VSGTAALLLLFIVLPIVVAPIVIAIVARRSPVLPPGMRISELLEHGEPGDAELLEWENKGPFLFDSRPMVAFHLSVRCDDEQFELDLTQSVPRQFVAGLSKGMMLDVRVSPDRTAGAIVLPMN